MLKVSHPDQLYIFVLLCCEMVLVPMDITLNMR